MYVYHVFTWCPRSEAGGWYSIYFKMMPRTQQILKERDLLNGGGGREEKERETWCPSTPRKESEAERAREEIKRDYMGLVLL